MLINDLRMETVKDAQIMFLKQDVYLLRTLLERIHYESSPLNKDLSTDYISGNNSTADSTETRNNDDIYTALLERILNHLYAITHQLHSYSLLEAKSIPRKTKSPICPRLVTFGSIMIKLWRNINNLKDAKLVPCGVCQRNKEMTENVHGEKSTQTFEITSSKCDSCYIAEECIRNLLKSFRGNEHISVLSCSKLKTEDLISVTQQGIMLRITSALEKDLSTLSSIIHHVNSENELLEEKSNKLNEELDAERQFSSAIMEENKSLEEKISEHETVIKSLTAEVERVVRKNEQAEESLESLRDKLAEYLISGKKNDEIISGYRKEIKQMKFTLLNLENALCNDFGNRIKGLNVKFDQFNENISELGEVVVNATTSIETLWETIDKIKLACSEIDSRIADLIDKCSLSNYVQTLFNKCQAVTNIAQNTSDVDRCNPTAVGGKKFNTKMLNVHGDPLADMMQQIEENKRNIKLLEDDNSRLESIIKVILLRNGKIKC